MHVGLFGINMNFLAAPKAAADLALQAEQLGFESLWTGEHVVLPDPQEAPSPAPPHTPMLHPPVALAYLAGITNTIKFGTGITLIAQRNPVVLAKEIASLDVLCDGRLMFGIGAGYLHQEFMPCGRFGVWKNPNSAAVLSTLTTSTRNPGQFNPTAHRSSLAAQAQPPCVAQ